MKLKDLIIKNKPYTVLGFIQEKMKYRKEDASFICEVDKTGRIRHKEGMEQINKWDIMETEVLECTDLFNPKPVYCVLDPRIQDLKNK